MRIYPLPSVFKMATLNRRVTVKKQAATFETVQNPCYSDCQQHWRMFLYVCPAAAVEFSCKVQEFVMDVKQWQTS